MRAPGDGSRAGIKHVVFIDGKPFKLDFLNLFPLVEFHTHEQVLNSKKPT